MRTYTLDCEFNGYQGRLLSLALFCPQRSFYGVIEEKDPTYTPWVAEHVAPLLLTFGDRVSEDNPDLAELEHGYSVAVCDDLEQLRQALLEFITLGHQGEGRPSLRIHTDWPDDVKYFSELLLTGPGTMLEIESVEFKINRVDSYPTNLVKGAIQHHAWWDAYVLYEHLNAMQRERILREDGSRLRAPRWPTF